MNLEMYAIESDSCQQDRTGHISRQPSTTDDDSEGRGSHSASRPQAEDHRFLGADAFKWHGELKSPCERWKTSSEYDHAHVGAWPSRSPYGLMEAVVYFYSLPDLRAHGIPVLFWGRLTHLVDMLEKLELQCKVR